jgi:ubiquinone biosynthesis monooxygenase Coq7
MSELSVLDKLLCGIDTALRTLIVPDCRQSNRASPAIELKEPPLTPTDKAHVAGLMRVNHAGEVCAQALYQGQALTAQLRTVREQMTQAAAEEVDHLAWCEQRLRELNSQPSLLNPLWYTGSFLIGALAGLAGDRWSLGFVAETERQVSNHLEKHLQHLPEQDHKSNAILKMMQTDEAHHAEVAIQAGAAELPPFIKQCMQTVSKIMTESSYHL